MSIGSGAVGFFSAPACYWQATIRQAIAIDEVSFPRQTPVSFPSTLEGMCAQDIVALDALGAVGIAYLAYGGGSRGMYDPE